MAALARQNSSRQLVGGTLANDVLHRLRDDIISGTLAPDEKLRFDMLRTIYGASFSTMREALSALASEGLVEGSGQRGFRVAEVSRDDLMDLTEARVLVEREVLARSMKFGDDNWEANLLAAYHRLDRAAQRGIGNYHLNKEWAQLHKEFHEAFAAACQSPTLMSFRNNLFERAHRYRCLAALAPNPVRDKNNEHRELTELAIRRNPDALDLVAKHIRGTTQNVLSLLQMD